MTSRPLQLHAIVGPEIAQNNTAPDHQIIKCDQLQAIVSRDRVGLQCDDLPEALLLEAVAYHHDILLEYCTNTPLIPARFGTLFSSADAVQAAIISDGRHHVDRLHWLADKREYSLVLTVLPPAPVERSSEIENGRAFLLCKRQKRNAKQTLSQERTAFITAITEKIAGLSAYPAAQHTPAKTPLLSFNLLLAPDAVARAHQIIDQTQADAHSHGISLALKGPYPAYSFASVPLPEPLSKRGIVCGN